MPEDSDPPRRSLRSHGVNVAPIPLPERRAQPKKKSTRATDENNPIIDKGKLILDRYNCWFKTQVFLSPKEDDGGKERCCNESQSKKCCGANFHFGSSQGPPRRGGRLCDRFWSAEAAYTLRYHCQQPYHSSTHNTGPSALAVGSIHNTGPSALTASFAAKY